MNELKIFNNEEFGQIRTVVIEGEPWFVGKDIAEALGYGRTADAIKQHVEEGDKLTRCFTDSGQSRQMYIINESGLYALIFGSKLESAKRFKHWVTSEVLPTIRKTGFYILKANQQYKANLLLSIYNGGQEGVIASRELTKLKLKKLLFHSKKKLLNSRKPLL